MLLVSVIESGSIKFSPYFYFTLSYRSLGELYLHRYDGDKWFLGLTDDFGAEYG
jgi:hypothetical protein